MMHGGAVNCRMSLETPDPRVELEERLRFETLIALSRLAESSTLD